MLNLSRLFDIMFMEEKISRQEFRVFVEDFLKKLAVQNAVSGGMYSAMLTATIAAYEAYFGAITDLDTKKAIQEGRTQAMNAAMRAFQEAIQSKGLIIQGTFKDKPELQEFFPQGMSEFSQATLETVETLMKRMESAIGVHVGTLGAAMHTEFKEYLSLFQEARGVQLARVGEVNESRQNTNETRYALAKLMTENVLDIAKNNVGKPEAAKLFFDQSLLEDKKKKEEEEPTPPVQ